MKVYLSPGHGGSDPGAAANGVQEKAVNLAVSLLVRDMLKAHGCEVKMGRETDTYVPYSTRITQANKWPADCYIAIHHNAADNQEAKGFEVYHSIIPTSKGKVLAEYIVERMAVTTSLVNRGARTRESEIRPGVDYYIEIREPKMPAVIVECGFLTNPDDAKYCASKMGQTDIAQGISQGILKWFGVDIGVEKPFKDIEGHWAENDILEAYKLGLVGGKGDKTFAPNDLATRAEVTAIALRVYKALKGN